MGVEELPIRSLESISLGRQDADVFDRIALMKSAGYAVDAKVSNIFGDLQLVYAKPKLPEDVEKFLTDELGVTDIQRDGPDVKMKLATDVTKRFPGAPPIWFDKSVSFTVTRGRDSISIKDVKGVMVDIGIPVWMNVYDMNLEMKNGKCMAKIEGGRFLYKDKVTKEVPKELYELADSVLKANGR